jgi:hypothetical protein
MSVAPQLVLTEDQERTLYQWARGRSSPGSAGGPRTRCSIGGSQPTQPTGVHAPKPPGGPPPLRDMRAIIDTRLEPHSPLLISSRHKKATPTREPRSSSCRTHDTRTRNGHFRAKRRETGFETSYLLSPKMR